MSPRNGMINTIGMPQAMQMLVSGHAATSRPDVGTSRAGTLPDNHAPAHTETPMASLLTETQRISGSFNSWVCTLLNSESGSNETKLTPASFKPFMISLTASSVIAINQPHNAMPSVWSRKFLRCHCVTDHDAAHRCSRGPLVFLHSTSIGIQTVVTSEVAGGFIRQGPGPRHCIVLPLRSAHS